MSKRILLIAFHFPPIKISSGLERTLALTRHLPAHGWEPMVLSASPKAYPGISDERMGQIPSGTLVRRPFARDATRSLSIAGRYPRFVTLPDRWASWLLGAIPEGLSLIREFKPDLIWSTYPIASAHLIGCALHRMTGVPWVADFRDPMVEFNAREQRWAPAWNALRHCRLWIEGLATRHAAALTACTNGSLQILKERYTQTDQRLWTMVPNGYDESAFQAAEELARPPRAGDAVVLLHSGTIYPTPDRDPSHFLRALRHVIDQRGPGAKPVRVLLRASSVDKLYAPLLRDLQLEDHVQFAPAIAYQEALAEMMEVDGLLVFQGYTSNPAIPAKLYEYFRAGKPILAMADEHGDTAQLVRSLGAGLIAPLDNQEGIANAMHQYLRAIESNSSLRLAPAHYSPFERAQTVKQFADLFDELLACR
ncbi:MAG: glycosyltransferase [Burkholderiales bacterium]|nr:glycosyltransferase [Burkholderiales bacterium]